MRLRSVLFHTKGSKIANRARGRLNEICHVCGESRQIPHLPARASVGYAIKFLADAFLSIGADGNVEQALMGFAVLHDSRRLPLHREHHGALALLSCFMKSPDRRRKASETGCAWCQALACSCSSTFLDATRISDPCKWERMVLSRRVAVGMPVARHPPHRSVLALLTHTVLTLDVLPKVRVFERKTLIGIRVQDFDFR